MREIALELEARLSARLEFRPLLGWQAPEALTFEVLGLEQRTVGSSVPLPRALLKSILNLVMPSVFSKLLLTLLPHKLGSYCIASGEALRLGGQLRCAGAPLAALSANLTLSPSDVPRGRGDVSVFVKELRAAQVARSLLGLNDAQCRALAALMQPPPCGLLPQGAAVPRPASSGGGGGGGLSMSGLCALYAKYGDSSVWPDMCAVWQQALEAVCTSLPQPCAAPAFAALMAGPVAALARKPLRISFALHTLTAALNVDAAIDAVRDYCERAAREFAKNAKGQDQALLVQRPLAAQLEALDLWHAALLAGLRAFKRGFVSAAAQLLVSADAASFAAGLDSAHYEGPAHITLPLPLPLDGEGSAAFDLHLPDPKQAVHTLAHKLRYVLDSLSMEAFGTTPADHQHGSHSDLALASLAERDDLPPDLQDALAAWRREVGSLRCMTSTAPGASATSRRAAAAPAAAAGSGGGAGAGAGAGAVGVLDSTEVGRVLLRRLVLSLKLDERRLSELLAGGQVRDADLLGGLLGCYGSLFNLVLAPAAPPHAPGGAAGTHHAGGDGGAGAGPRMSMTLRNNEVTRLRADLEGAAFTSRVPPAAAVRLLRAVTLALLHKFGGGDGSDGGSGGGGGAQRRAAWLGRGFELLHEYLSKDALDVALCVSAGAHVVTEARRSGGGSDGDGKGPAAGGAGSLLLTLSGGGDGGGGAGRGGGGSAAGAAAGVGGSGVPPLYLVNDVNLLTMLDTVKLLMDY